MSHTPTPATHVACGTGGARAADIYEARCRRCFEAGGPAPLPELYPEDEEE